MVSSGRSHGLGGGTHGPVGSVMEQYWDQNVNQCFRFVENMNNKRGEVILKVYMLFNILHVFYGYAMLHYLVQSQHSAWPTHG